MLQLRVPDDAVGQAVRLAISEVAVRDVPPPPPGLRFGTTVRRVTPQPADAAPALARPLGLVVRFTPEDLAASGGITSGLRLLFWPVGASEWAEVPAQVDATGSLLRGELPGWGVVAVAGVVPQPPAPGRQAPAVAGQEPASSVPSPQSPVPTAWLPLAMIGTGAALCGAVLSRWLRRR